MLRNPICFALDFPKLSEAVEFMSTNGLCASVGAVKVGLELFMSSGRYAVKSFTDNNVPVVLDLKLHDIPETVERAVRQGGDMGVKYMTLHVQQRSTLDVALRAASPYSMTLLGVTVLTSMEESDGQDLGYSSPWPQDRAWHLARFAYEQGLRGFVCSPHEVNLIKKDCPGSFFLVPGVRPRGVEPNDQKRVATPGGACLAGADLLVIGRPIRDAKDPQAAVQGILSEIESVR